VDLDVPAGSYLGFNIEVVMQTDGGATIGLDAAELVAPQGLVGAISSGDCRPDDNCSPSTFAVVLLAQPGIASPSTTANLFAMESWERAEGGGAGCGAQAPFTAPWSYSGGPAGNPINTTQSNAGSQAKPWNSVGVQQFTSQAGETCWYWGVSATAQTLLNGYYPNIIQVLQNPSTNNVAQCDALAVAVGNSPWGTGNFSADC